MYIEYLEDDKVDYLGRVHESAEALAHREAGTSTSPLFSASFSINTYLKLQKVRCEVRYLK